MICTLSADFFYRLLREERVSPDNFFSGLLTILNRQGLHPLYHSCGYSGCRVIYLLLQFRCFHHLVPEHNRESHLLHIQVVDHPRALDHFVITWRRTRWNLFLSLGRNSFVKQTFNIHIFKWIDVGEIINSFQIGFLPSCGLLWGRGKFDTAEGPITSSSFDVTGLNIFSNPI